MTESNNPLRIDWFDGTIIDEPRTSLSKQPSPFGNDEVSTGQTNFMRSRDNKFSLRESPQNHVTDERKLMGYKRIFDLSQQEDAAISLSLSGRSSFWDLLDSDLKGDFIVLIVKILYKLCGIQPDRRTKNKYYDKVLLHMVKVLETNFFQTLTKYLLKLPNTRITEKKMNMQFWDEPENFFSNVVTLSLGIYKADHEDFKEKFSSVLEALRVSLDGLMFEHQEQFSEELFKKVDDLEYLINCIGEPSHSLNETKEQRTSEKQVDPRNFRTMSIFPTRDDLLGLNPERIHPNIVNGAYSSVEHYLEVQYKLLREDIFGPLREGINKYMKNPSQTRHENIRVHPEVRFIRTYATSNKVGYLVDLAWKERRSFQSVDCKRYLHNKQLMFGSLLLFTNDEFKTVICATVINSSSSLLEDGYIAALIVGPVSHNIYSQQYLMVESQVFFEPYHQVLKVLKEFYHENIPMQRYIVDVQPLTKHPSYLTEETRYIFTKENGSGEEISYPVLDLDSWPDGDVLGLDPSQREAYKLALTREFAVIQGPPGTGKTYIGIQIAKTLLLNHSLEGTPMLILCYTNHALDQFLEGILKITDNVIRLGNQSKNPALEPYTLNNLRSKRKSRYSHLYSVKRREQETLFNQMMSVQDELEKCDKEIISYKSMQPYLTNSKQCSFNQIGNEDPILPWLFNDKDTPNSASEDGSSESGEFENFTEQTALDHVKLNTCFSENWAENEVNSMKNSMKYVRDITDGHDNEQTMINRFETQIGETLRRLDCFKKNFSKQQEFRNRQIEAAEDLYALSLEDRWSVYFKAVHKIKDALSCTMNQLQETHQGVSQELEELSTLVDAAVVREARVLGLTTTTAARRHALLQQLKSPILIVEEAAEILEGHIIASLTHHCQHVILIGDHKQLRPTAAHYKLAQRCNLEVSLFERMVRNEIHACTLTTQRRMRPEFLSLIAPIYKALESHPSVTRYPNIRGMERNLYFYDQGQFEDESIKDNWSHQNQLEARWCVALADYLRRYYEPHDITILTTYTGQAQLIKQLSKNMKSMVDVKTTVVDNFQGEESRIVILSLVRSNKEGNIGFVAAENRICVALSRAREGFYIIGNMAILKSTSPVWRSVYKALESQKAIGRAITLQCETHKSLNVIRNVTDLEKIIGNECSHSCCESKT